MRFTGKRIAILLAEGVEDLEYYVPLMRLQEEGADVISAALELKPGTGGYLSTLGLLREKQHRAEEATTLFEQAVNAGGKQTIQSETVLVEE